ncbi:MAG TPA: acetate--CoA ligase family protein, partial [Ramlibacter sp.]|nr:acetate--CoA ligase family protein [Ramlibacter sp.]
AGFGALAQQLVEMFDQLRHASDKPILLTWQSMPEGTAEQLAARGIHVFTEPARAVRVLGHLVRHAHDLRQRVHRAAGPAPAFDWDAFVPAGTTDQVVSEHVVSRILEAAQLPVARGRVAQSADEAVRAAQEVGFPVAIKGLSPAITHRAAAGLVALNVASDADVARTQHLFTERAAARGVELEGIWVQHMFSGDRELLVTAFRDREFGVMVGIGLGGGLTEIIDDVVFARAPLDADAALALLSRLRTLRRLPELLTHGQQQLAAAFLTRFSALAASAPWPGFTLEVNPVKLADDGLAAVDGLLLID